jgi:hypothetical protein
MIRKSEITVTIVILKITNNTHHNKRYRYNSGSTTANPLTSPVMDWATTTGRIWGR